MRAFEKALAVALIMCTAGGCQRPHDEEVVNADDYQDDGGKTGPCEELASLSVDSIHGGRVIFVSFVSVFDQGVLVENLCVDVPGRILVLELAGDSVLVVTRQADGKPQILDFRSPGDSFGMLDSVLDLPSGGTIIVSVPDTTRNDDNDGSD